MAVRYSLMAIAVFERYAELAPPRFCDAPQFNVAENRLMRGLELVQTERNAPSGLV